ncbi:MAG: SDR family oxidoreductase [Clostridia bacterium]|nr:SDR family oxidoreductase [Clostridia bacterium]
MNKVALITGGARGIGQGLVRGFVSDGYSVVFSYNTSKADAEKMVSEFSGKAVAIKCDISKEEEIVEMVEFVKSQFGRIDVLINNAGVAIDKLFSDRTAEDFKYTFDVNVTGTFLVSKYVGELMCEQKSGKIINISSTNGINTYFPMCIDYDASKSAIISLTHNLAVQFAPYVNVNAIAPGFIGTESEINAMDKDFIEMEKEKILVRRIGEVDDVVNLALFLSSDKSSFINNTVIRIDGGMYGSC